MQQGFQNCGATAYKSIFTQSNKGETRIIRPYILQYKCVLRPAADDDHIVI